MRAASIRFLLGRQPRLTQVPPRVRDSVMIAVLPSSAALSAAAKAVEPEPRITRSKRSAAIVLVLGRMQAGTRDVGADHRAGEQLLGVLGEQLLGDAQQGAH